MQYGTENQCPLPEFRGALVKEVYFHGKSVGRSAKCPSKRGALVREVPT